MFKKCKGDNVNKKLDSWVQSFERAQEVPLFCMFYYFGTNLFMNKLGRE